MNKETDTFVQSKYMAYKSGYKYQIHEDFYYKLTFRPVSEKVETRFITLYPDGWLVIKNGYSYDGASGITYDSKNTMRASLVHDALYQLMRMELIEQMYRDESDEELYILIREDGMWYIRAKSWHLAVTYFADSAADPKNRKKVLFAP